MRIWRIVAAALAMACAAIGGERAQAQNKSTIIERVLVRVNGEIYTQSQLTQNQTDALRARNRQPRNVPETELVKLLNDVTPDVLVDAVDELLVAQHGRELGAKFTDEDFKKGLDSIKKENNLDDAQLKQALQQEALTLDDLRTNFEKARMIQAVQTQEILPRMRITEEELRQYYTAHRDELVTPETITLREFAVLVPGQGESIPAADAAAAKAKIEDVRKRALAGEDFAALVKEMSDAPTKSNAGLIGPVNVADINPILKDLMAKLRPGDITEPVQLPRGYQMFKLEQREVAVPQPFEKVRDKIELAIRNQRLDGEMRKLTARLRAQALIEWKDENLRVIYQKRLAERYSTP